jgi:2'-5' RNA ligase
MTAVFDAASALRLDAERRAYYPAGRNQVPAHCTLFHQLPGEHEETVLAEVATACAGLVPFTGFVGGVLSFGRGVAYAIDAPALVGLRNGLAIALSRWLSDQDRQRYRPHVTIQNKADPAVARRLLASLEEDFTRWPLRIEGLALWRYRGGPWEPAATCRFGQEPVRTQSV